MAQVFWQTQWMSKKPTSYVDVLNAKPKINLFDFWWVKQSQPTQTKQMNFWQPVSQRNVTNFADYQSTLPKQTIQQPTQKSGFSLFPTANAMEEKDLIQTFLDDNTVNVQNRQTVFEMLKDNVPKNVIEDAIINKAWYKWTQPQQEQPWFLSKVWQWFTDISRNIYEWVENVWADVINVWLSAFLKEPIKPMREQLIPTWEEYKWWLLKKSFDTIWKRWTELWEIIDVAWEEQTKAESVVQWVAKVGRWILDIAWDTFMSWLSTLTPDKQKEQITNLITNIAQTEWWQKAIETAETLSNKYKEFKTNNPRAWRNVDAIWTFIEWALEIAWVWLAWKWITKWLDKTIDLWTTWIEKTWEVLTKWGKLLSKWVDKILPSKPTIDKIYDSYNKWVAPSVKIKENPLKAQQHKENVITMWTDIVENKNKLKYTDTEWNIIAEWKLPESIDETAQAITQRNDEIFNEYRNLEKSTWLDKEVSYQKVVDNLWKLRDEIKSNPELQDLLPFIDKKIERYSKAKWNLDTTINAKKSLNQKLKAFYKKWSYDDVWKDAVDLVVNKTLWEILDETISNSSYTALKQKWGALKNLQEEIFKRNAVSSRAKEFSLFDLTNPISAMEVIQWIATWNALNLVKASWIQWVKWYMKFRNSPNTQIREFFKQIEKWLQKWDLKSNQIKNVNIPTSSSVSIPVSESKQIKPSILSPREKELLKPNSTTNVSNKTNTSPNKTWRELLKKVLPSNFKEKAQDFLEWVAEKVGAKKNLLPRTEKQVSIDKTKLLKPSDKGVIKEVNKLNTWEDIVLIRWTWWWGSWAGEAIRWKWLYLTDNTDVAKHYGKNIEKITIKNSNILDWNETLKNSKSIIDKLPKDMQNYLDKNWEYSYNQLIRDIEWNTWLEAEKIADELNHILKQKYQWVRFNIWLVNDSLSEKWLWNKNAFIIFGNKAK